MGYLNGFDADAAIADAREAAGLRDFGDDPFVEALTNFLEFTDREVPLNDIGVMSIREACRRYLVTRLRLHRDLVAHPEILEEDISKPIMILGMPRSGTTKFQRMMTADPAVQNPTLWRMLNPVPFENEVPGKPVERIAFAKALEEMMKGNKDVMAQHEMVAEEAEEDAFLLNFSFEHPVLFHLIPSTGYVDWLRTRSLKPAYDMQTKYLKYLQWQDGGRRGRPWVLKNPQAIGVFGYVNEYFPDAVYIHFHRDLTEVIPSMCKLMASFFKPTQQTFDPHKHGRDVLAYWSEQMANYLKDRARLEGKIDIVDVAYKDALRDPIRFARDLYQRAGIELTPQGEAAMNAWSDANQQHKYGKPVYSAEEFGLTNAMIEDAFRPYAERFGDSLTSLRRQQV